MQFFCSFFSVLLIKIKEVRTYQCQHCEQKYAIRGTLDTHIQCQHCKQKYSQYMKEERKTFLCQHCEHKFTQKGRLNKHIKFIHEGKTFWCQHCRYKATTKGNLKTHILSKQRAPLNHERQEILIFFSSWDQTHNQ